MDVFESRDGFDILVGQLLGFPIRKHVHGERFRWLVLLLLFGAAISAIVNALV